MSNNRFKVIVLEHVWTIFQGVKPDFGNPILDRYGRQIAFELLTDTMYLDLFLYVLLNLELTRKQRTMHLSPVIVKLVKRQVGLMGAAHT